MINAIVIGGNGFLGAPLADALAGQGYKVTAFDRFSSGPPAFENRHVIPFVGDYFNRADLAEALKDQDLVFHFLSTTTPAAAEDDPLLDISTNVGPSVELMKLAVRAGVSRLFFASSGGAIYGNQGLGGYSEDDPTLPVSPYGIGKLAIEGYLKYFETKHGLRSVSFRLANPYGLGQHPRRRQGIIPIALARLRDDLPIIRLGDGTMVRDYIYLPDAVEMMLNVVNSEPRHQVYNIGSGHGQSVNEVLDVIRRVTERSLTVEEVAKPATFVDSVVLDITRYMAEYGTPALRTLEEGVDAVWSQLPRGGADDRM